MFCCAAVHQPKRQFSSATNLPIKSWFLIYIALSRFHPLLVKIVELYVTVEIIVCFRNLSGLYIYTISFSYAIAVTHQSPARSLTFLHWRQERKISIFYEAGECKGKDDAIPIARKYTINCSFSLISTTSVQPQRPFSIWTGHKLLQEYPNFSVGDTTQGMVFKLSDVTINGSC